MAKKFFFMTVLLLLLSSCILFFQWHGFSLSANEEKIFTEQSVVVTHEDDQFLIEQKITNVSPGYYQFIIPEEISQIECEMKQVECNWMGKDQDRLKIRSGNLTLTYTIPAPSHPQSYVLQNWLVAFKDLKISKTRIQLTEKSWRGGSWAANADKVGEKEMNTFDYHVFETDQNEPILYWQSTKLEKIKDNNMFAIYSEDEVPHDISSLHRLNIEKKLYVIITDSHGEFSGESLRILSPRDKYAAQILLQDLLRQVLVFPKEEEWLIQLVVSLQTGKISAHEKSNQLYTNLKESMNKEQLDHFLSLVMEQQENTISSTMLDKFIEQTTGFKTRFFELNANENGPFYSLLFMDRRDVYIMEQQVDNIGITFSGNQSYIDFIRLLEKFGYDAQFNKNDQSISSAGSGQTFHFNYGEKLFYLNNETYGIEENPFLIIDDDLYIETGWLSHLFQIKIKETAEAIYINRTK